jgi:hypothetical protein
MKNCIDRIKNKFSETDLVTKVGKVTLKSNASEVFGNVFVSKKVITLMK